MAQTDSGDTVRFNPFPKENKYFEAFRHHARIINEAAQILKEVATDWEGHEHKVRRITELEHEGDEIVHEVATSLHRTYITPIDREDIHELATKLDNVLDYIHGTAVRMELFSIGSANKTCAALATVLEASTVAIIKGVALLPTFKSLDGPRQEMERLEEESDGIYHQAVADLFEKKADAIFVIKWKELFEMLETAVDLCEDVFDVMDGIVIKHG